MVCNLIFLNIILTISTMNNVIVWLGLIGTVLGIITTLGGMIAFYRGSVIKGYAAKRDFEHIKNDIKGLSTNIDFLLKENEREIKDFRKDMDNRFDGTDKDLVEIKALLFANLGTKKSASKEYET